jgi:DNA-binding transcriptional MerR regulator
LTKTPPKSDTAFRTIREVADWLAVPTHVLRFWESKFEQIAPVKGAGGRRYYRPEDMRLLGGIKVLLHDQGMTVRAVSERIDGEGTASVMDLSPALETAGATAPPKRAPKVGRREDAGTPVPEAVPIGPDPESSTPPEPGSDLPQPVEPGIAAEAPQDPPRPVGAPADRRELLPDQPAFPDEVPHRSPPAAAPGHPDPAPPAPGIEPGPESAVTLGATSEPDEAGTAGAPAPPEPARSPVEVCRRAVRGATVAPDDRMRARRLARRLRALADGIREELEDAALR